MFGDLADVKQAVSSRNDFHERAKVRQPRNLPEIRLPYLGRRRDIADNLQRLRRRLLIAASASTVASLPSS
jgi:hypothetical protein